MTHPTPEMIEELDRLYEKATPGPYFVGHDDGEDTTAHRHAGLALIETGCSNDWPILRLGEWPTTNFICELLNAWPAIRQSLRSVPGQADALRQFYEGVAQCFGDTWQCEHCGHAEDWWTESNADYATRDARAAIAAPVQPTREAVIAECAKVCDREAAFYRNERNGTATAASNCADAIRKLAASSVEAVPASPQATSNHSETPNSSPNHPETPDSSPVAWMWDTGTNRGLTWTRCAPPEAEQATITPLYASPQKARIAALEKALSIYAIEPCRCTPGTRQHSDCYSRHACAALQERPQPASQQKDEARDD